VHGIGATGTSNAHGKADKPVMKSEHEKSDPKVAFLAA
jgi:hypothetical protein